MPGARAKAAAGDALFGTVDTWVLWNLTGGPSGGLHLTDVTNASRTQLMNLATRAWDDALLDAFTIPRTTLPRIAASSEVYGKAAIPALAGVPLAGILGDQQAALVGQTCFAPGEAKNTYGTGCFMLMNTGTQLVPSTAGLVTTVAYQLGKEPVHFALEGSIAIAGALVQWLRDNLGIIEKSSDVEALAREAQDNGDVYFVPAFSGLFAPHWKENARGAIVGLTRYANKSHLARAALESTAYQTREVLEAMEKDSRIPIKELRVDGGMVANELLDAVPIRPPRRAGGAAADHGNHGARRRVCGGPCGRLLVEPRRAHSQLGRRQALAPGHGRRRPSTPVWLMAKGRHALIRLDRAGALTAPRKKTQREKEQCIRFGESSWERPR